MSVEIRLREDGALAITGTGDPLELWRTSRAFFLARRPVRQGTLGPYPETTNGDVLQLALVWRRVFKQIWRSDIEAFNDRKAIWDSNQRTIDRHLWATVADAPFAANEAFWFAWTRKPAVWLSVMRDQPSRWEMVVDAAKQTLTHLPEALADRASDVAAAAAAVGYKVGEVVSAPVRGAASGLFGRLGTPLLIGAAVIGGVLLVPRIWPRRDRAAAAGGAS